jgi:hypothetical protein
MTSRKTAALRGSVSATAATIAVVGLTGRAAWADSVVITPMVSAVPGNDEQTCEPVVAVSTHATFDRPVRLGEVVISFQGINLLGNYQTHNLNGATQDEFLWHSPAADAKPGQYSVLVKWFAQGGNGLNRGIAQITSSFEIKKRNPSVRGQEFSSQTKCEATQSSMRSTMRRPASLLAAWTWRSKASAPSASRG